MMEETKREYGVMSVTGYYGPREERRLVASDLTEIEAREQAAAYDPDYDEGVRCHRLAHNQSSATTGVPVEIIGYYGSAGEFMAMSLIPGDVEDRAEEIVRSRYGDPNEARRVMRCEPDDEAWYSAVEEAFGERSEYIVEQDGDWYWVRSI